MEKPNIIDKRTVRLEEITKTDFIPFLGGRPVRESVISKDDTLNLSIMLNTTVSIDAFLTSMSSFDHQ